MVIMSSSPNFGHKKCPKVEVDEDRISRLPDEILFHILSFLPTKDVVRTSIFSKRWTHIWTSVPTITIFFGLLQPSNFKRHYSPELKTCFINFVDRVLHLNSASCLRKFYLSCFYHHPSRVREWIREAFMSDVEEFEVHLQDHEIDPNLLRDQRVEFPLSVFTSKKLVILKMSDFEAYHNYVINLTAAVVNLPSLKILHLHSIQFLDDDSMNKVIDGCPALEELDIEIGHGNSKTLTIRSNSLKSLRLGDWHCCDDNIQLNIFLDAKNLERLDLVDHVRVKYDVNTLSSLVKVNLRGCTSCSRRGTNVYVNHSQLVELIRKLSSTKQLFLSTDEILRRLETLQLNDLHLPVYDNLTHFELDYFNNEGWKVLPYLFERLPGLITFVLHRDRFCKQRWKQPRRQFHAPECLMLNLEEVKLTKFRACEDEMEMVRFFLKSATTLKKMSIQSSYKGYQKLFEISQELLTFKRGSSKCQILIN